MLDVSTAVVTSLKQKVIAMEATDNFFMQLLVMKNSADKNESFKLQILS